MINIHGETSPTTIRRSCRVSVHHYLIGILLLAGSIMATPDMLKAQTKDPSPLPIKDPSLLPKGVDPKMPRDGFGFLLEASFAMTVSAEGARVTRATAYPKITHIIAGTPAEAANLVPGDVLLSANGQDLIAQPYRWNAPPGTVVTLRVQHGDAIQEVRLTSVHWYTPPDSLVAKTKSK